jgi:hypothetical protein
MTDSARVSPSSPFIPDDLDPDLDRLGVVDGGGGGVDISGLSPDGRLAVGAFASALTGPEAGRRLTGLAGVLAARGLRADAARLCQQAMQADDDPEVAVRARHVCSSGIPDWHVALLHDEERACAYDRAIRRAVQPGSLVLDIGTGSGLLAMMAARAGAGSVVACERDPVLAEAAAEIVAQNGLSERIRVIAKDSRQLIVGEDLPRRADLVISEIVSNDLLAEGALETLRSARRDLLIDGAPALPSGGRISAALVALDRRDHRPIATLVGFDLSRFNAYTPPRKVINRWKPVALMSEVADLFAFDLSGGASLDQRRVSRSVELTRSGRVDGIVQWMGLDLFGDVQIGTGPDAAPTAWGKNLHVFDHPLEGVEGQVVEVHAWHNRSEVLVWAGRTSGGGVSAR